MPGAGIRGKQLEDATVPAGKCDTTNGTISTVEAGDAAAEGSGTGVSRRDHQHAVSTGTPGSIQPDDTADGGSAASLARSDHTHGIVAAAPAQGIGGGDSEGNATSFARSNHDHTIRETGGPTNLTVAGVADGQLVNRSGTTLAGVNKPTLSKSITVESPTASEDISIFFTNLAITITEIRAVVRGTTPSVTWTVRHGTSRSGAGAEAVTGGTTTTDQSTGSDVTTFNDATIVTDSFVWLETTAQTGTVEELAITIFYTED